MDLRRQPTIRRLLILFTALAVVAVAVSLLPLAALDWERVCEGQEREIASGYQFARGLIQERIVAARLLAEQMARQPGPVAAHSGQATLLVLSSDGQELAPSLGCSLPRLSGLAAQLAASPLSGVEVDSQGRLLAVGTCPRPGQIVVAALPFTAADAQAIREATGLESSFFAGSVRAVTSLRDHNDQPVTDPLSPEEWAALLPQAGRLRWVSDPDLAGQSYLRLTVPLYGLDGTPVGAYSIGRSAARHWALLAGRMVLWGGVLLGLAVLIALLALWFGARLLRPLCRLRRSLAGDGLGQLLVGGSGLPEVDGLLQEIGRLRLAHDALARKNEALSKQVLQTQSLAALGQLAAGVAHDLNNPLTTIMGLADILQSSGLAEEARRDLAVIRRQAERSGRMVRGLLGFARRQRSDPQWVSLNDTIAQTLELLAYQARVNNIQCDTRLDPDLPLTWADLSQMQQVLFNLINNAMQAMASAHKRGHLLVESSWSRPTAGAPHGRVIIHVQDDGPGIPPEVLPRLFQTYFTTKAPGDGYGLGLVIAASVVTRHSGRIWAENQPEGGARFFVELPVTPEPPPAAQGERPGAGAAANGGHNILLADSDAQRVGLLARILRREGYGLWTAGDGLLAQSKIEMEEFDLILCALEMSRLGGRELYTWAMAHHAELAGRFVFILANQDGHGDPFLQETRAPVLRPPFQEEIVESVVREALHTIRQGSHGIVA